MFESSREVGLESVCIIDLNYNPLEKKGGNDKNLEIKSNEFLGYMMSNYPLFNINKSDVILLKKHKININKIILP
jgi:hypothetical protein